MVWLSVETQYYKRWKVKGCAHEPQSVPACMLHYDQQQT